MVTPLGVMLCRPSEAVLELLPVGPISPFQKEDGEWIRNSSRVVAGGWVRDLQELPVLLAEHETPCALALLDTGRC